MSLQAGVVQSLSGGKFFAKDINGNTREIKSGDIIYENDTVYGDSSNTKANSIVISLAGNDIIVLQAGQKQLIDPSLIETAYGNDELFFTTEAALANIDAYKALADLESDLRAAAWNDGIDSDITDAQGEDGEVTAGEEEVEDEEGEGSKFATRDGDATDIESDLRKKGWLHTRDYREFESNKNILDHNEKDLGKTSPNPFDNTSKPIKPNAPHTSDRPHTKPTGEPEREFTPKNPDADRPKSDVEPNEPTPTPKPTPTPEPTPKPTPTPEPTPDPIPTPEPTPDPIPTPEPTPDPIPEPEPEPEIPVPVANLSINDVTMYEQDGFMVFTVTLDKPASGNITVNFATSNGTAEAGKDYTHTTGTITIPNGSTTAQIRVPIKDDYYYEKSEHFNVTLTNPIGNVNIVKGTGVGTILDNPPTTEKTPIESNTPDSGTGTYDSGDTVYVKLVNSATTIEDMTGHMTPITIDGVKNDGILEHFLQLVDKNGNYVEIPDGKSITVTLEYSSLQGTIDNSDFDNSPIGASNKVEITLTKDNLVVNHDGTLSYKITNHAIIEAGGIPAEELESYNLKITDIKQNGDAFENVVIHKDFDTVTGTIIDVSPTVGAVATPEDTAKDISLTETSKTITKMLVDNGKGFVEVSDGDKVNLYDNGKVIGTITYDETNKKFVFDPSEDYSNHKNEDDIKFMYFADFGDNTNEFKQVKVQVTPVADAPTVTVNDVTTYEDNQNTQEGQHKIALELKTPTLSKDQTDKNGATGDHPERNGEITLKFTNGNLVSGAKLFNGDSEVATITTANQEIKVVIVKTSGQIDVDYDYHHADITASNPSGTVLYLTKSEYENLKIQHAEDNDTDIKINIGVTSYELDDDGKPLAGSADYSKSTNADMTVVILPVTDDISIKWDDNSLGTISNNDKTYTFTDITKVQYVTLKLQDIMSATSGAQNGIGGTKGDLDGSEKRTYIIEGLPKDAVVTLGTTAKTVGADGKVIIDFPDNTKDDPAFSVKLPQYYQGTVNATITLKVQDRGVEESSDSSKWGAEKTDSINFKINVLPTIINDSSNETIQIAQAIGNEDAGRGKNNVLNSSGAVVSSSANITNPENGLKLNIEPKGSNMAAKGETATIWIDKVPIGGSLYIYDNSTKTYKLIGVEGGKVYEYSKSGSEYTIKTELSGGKTGNVTVSLNGDGTYKVEILDYQNSKLPTFIPPHNDDTDYTFQISGEKVSSAVIDGQTVVSTKPYNGGTPLNMSVIVKNVADEPINTELVDSGDKIVDISGTKYIKATEDQEFKLVDIYKNGTPSSFDNDGSEVLSIKITLPAGVTMVDGAKYKVDENEYVVKSTDLDKIKLTFPKNFSGTVGDIKLKYTTTEQANENSSKTHFEQTVKLFVNPVADDVDVATSSTIHEDADGSTNKINLKPTSTDTDGSETITSIKILASSLPSGYKLYSDSSMTTELTTDSNGDYIVSNPDSVYIKNTTPHSADSSDNFSLQVVYTVKDEKNGQIDIKDFTHTHNVIVKAVTDQPGITLVDDQTTTTTQYNDTDKTGTNIVNKGQVEIWSANSDFTVQVKTTSPDNDGSEKVQRIEIHGVPKGVTVDGAVFKGYTGTDSGVWVIYPSDKTLDTNGAFTDVKFIITEGANFNNRDMTIKTITKDIGAEEKSATLNVNMEMKYTYTGPGTGGSTPDFELTLKNPTIDEERPFTLKDLYDVSYSAGNIQGSHWAADFTDLPAGTTFKVKEGMTGVNIYTYTDGGGKLHYVLSGSNQNKDDIESVFERIEIITPKDINSLQDGALKGDFNITGTISSTNGAYAHQGAEKKYENYTINPVTDPMTITIATGESSLKEDEVVELTIKLSNGSDKTKAALVDGVITLKINESWSDNLSIGTGGVKGTLGQTGTNYTIVDNNNGTYTITKASGNFVLDSNGNLDIPNLVYTPAANRDGEVKFEVSVKNQETGSTVTLDSKGDKTITVTPIIDATVSSVTTSASSNEDTVVDTLKNAIEVKIENLTMPDASETLGNIILDKIPTGMTVWYMDHGTLKAATNIGTSTGAYTLNPYGENTNTGVNKWLIPTFGDGTLPQIYINAPENWSGTFNYDLKLSVYEQNLATPVEKSLTNQTATIDPEADGFSSASATKMTKNVFQWLDLQINANMKDTDGSEVMNVELSGLSKDAQFKLKDGSIFDKDSTNPKAEWNASTSKWTISGVKVGDINKIQFMDMKATSSVTADIWTQEQSNNSESSKTTLTDLAKINGITGGFTFDKELSLDFNNIDPIKTGGTYNIGLKDITSINLGSSNGAKNELLNLTLQDVLDMGKKDNDGKINLEILGGGTGANKDKVTFADNGNWTKSAEVNQNGYWEYTNTDDTVKVQIKSDIEQPI